MTSAAFADVKDSPQGQRAMPRTAVWNVVRLSASVGSAQVKSANSDGDVERSGRGRGSRL